MSKSRTRRVLITLIGVLSVGLVLAPGAWARTKVHTTVIDGTFSDAGFLRGFEGVSPTPPSVPSEGVFRGSSHVYGDNMHGDVDYTLWGSPNPAGYFDFHTVEVFTGFVADCGTGSMTYDVVGTSDPRQSNLEGTWTIVPGSGTDGLAGVKSGGGHLEGTTGPTVTSPDPTTNSGTITGSVSCTRLTTAT